MKYRLELSDAALRALRRLPEPMRSRMAEGVNGLANDPYPPGSKLLHGRHEGHRRIRVGDYRAIYGVDDVLRVVAVVRIGPRGTVYRG